MRFIEPLLFLGVMVLAHSTPEAQPNVQIKLTDASEPLEKVTGSTTNSIGMILNRIPAGTFVMGSNDGDKDEQPPHKVIHTKPFFISVFEVTQEQYRKVIGANPSRFSGKSLPVERVSWNDAIEFCKGLTQLENQAGALPEGFVYSLPTEAQWEYACRAGSTAEASFGEAAGSLSDIAWNVANSGSRTHPVGQKKANAWGLYDMHGNVWEWCLDWYEDSYQKDSIKDPAGPAKGTQRVVRGGGWLITSRTSQWAHRGRSDPNDISDLLGFRVTLSKR